MVRTALPPVQPLAFSVPTSQEGEGPPRERNGPSWKVLCTCKPGPVPRLRGVSVIYLGSASRRTSIDPPPGIRARYPIRSEERTPVYMVFQPVGFTKPPMSPPALVSSYLTFSPLPRRSLGEGGPSLSSHDRLFPFLRHFP